MFKLIAVVFAAILAVTVATPGVISSGYIDPATSSYGYSGYSPLTYSAGYPYAYSGYNNYGNYYGYAAPYAYRYY